MLAEISRALEERDRTQGHGSRVALLAQAIAVRLGWHDERLELLRLGAQLHDIGKVAVPGEVLGKREPLTPSELAQIRVHPRAGAELIEPVEDARPLLPYVLYHHERWDGDGYPCGIAGEDIPVEARVLAVADAYDAMTSPRPYRAPLAAGQALAEVRRCAGTQFDPVVASMFCEAWTTELAAH
jgi:HD-GYP domain-containing protein (c-di-GMP phosphodiesterase class II)